MKNIKYDGINFYKDNRTGYYYNSTHREHLHRRKWKCEVGDIPEGMHIHHINHDISDNRVENYELITASDHAKYHIDIYVRLNYDKMIKNLDEVARPKASEWHGSEEGIAWHKEHYENTKDKLHATEDKICDYCEKEFNNIKHARFCSNKCKSAHRRASGVDNVTRQCVNCGEDFVTDKNRKTSSCSRSCGMTYSQAMRRKT